MERPSGLGSNLGSEQWQVAKAKLEVQQSYANAIKAQNSTILRANDERRSFRKWNEEDKSNNSASSNWYKAKDYAQHIHKPNPARYFSLQSLAESKQK